VSGSPATLAGLTLALQGLRTALYPAPDLDAARSWWSLVLGIQPYFDAPLLRLQYRWLRTGPSARCGRGRRSPHLLGVEDVQAAVHEAVAAGATEHTPVSDVGDGIITATLRTPTGSILGLIFNPHFAAR